MAFIPSASSDMLQILFILLTVSLAVYRFCHRRPTNTNTIPTNWPLLGMTPALLLNAHRVHDFATDILKQTNSTFMFKGPWFANLDMLLTCDPANIHYMLSKNFPNYPKGPEFRKIFDILGDGIFNSDHELWELHRKTTLSLLKHPHFHTLLETNLRNKVHNGLLPVLDSVLGMEIDLQEIFQRFTFDAICNLLLDYDPQSLSPDLPFIPCEKAFTGTEEALLYRHVFPEKVWKLQKLLGIGKEKKLSEAWMTFDEFIYKCLSCKQEDVIIAKDFGLLKGLMKEFKDQSGTSGDPRKFLKDALLNLMIAGRDTTSTALSWFFYLLAQNPDVENKIRKEMETKMGGEKWKGLRAKDLGELVYLHGALCEALRLFPPVALEHKAPSEADVLPSGHVVDQHSKIILPFYSMGRMERIWGKDCMEFKPERWLTERGSIKHEPSYKFPAFHAGPRTCLGKEMAFVQMKMVASSLIRNYKVEVVKGHPVTPSDSIILHMKYGLMVKLFKVKK